MPSVADARTSREQVRIAHLGLGHFHRAHQAWYTQCANALSADHGAADGWGIAAFTGRSPRAAEVLAAQDGVYTLITRSADGDRAEVIQSISAAYDGAGEHWESTLARPEVAVLTVTVTERGYDPDPARSAASRQAHSPASAESAGARIARGLLARARASAGPIALVSCDNLNGNGDALRAAVLREADDELASWIASNASFVSTMVDRITPATTDADRAVARDLTGYDDAAPVVTEPFSEWVVAGEFPAGRPAWDRVGVTFVHDIEPYERRKLWLLNAGHTLLAAVGLAQGFETVDQAFADAGCRELLEEQWAEARVELPFDASTTDAFLADLRTRFANPRIAHRLAQIDDGSLQKLRQRQVEIIQARLEAGADPGTASLTAIRAWGRSRGLDLSEALDALKPGLARRVGES